MRNQLPMYIGSSLLAGLIAAMPISNALASGKPKLRSWSPADSLAVRYYAWDPSEPKMIHPARAEIATKQKEWPAAGFVWSPDLQMVALIHYRGGLQADRGTTTLQIFSSHSIADALKHPRSGKSNDSVAPYLEFTLPEDKSGSSGIIKPTWSADSRRIYFFGTAPDGSKQVHSIDVETGNLTQITSSDGATPGFFGGGDRAIFRTLKNSIPEFVGYPNEPLRHGEDGVVLRQPYDKYPIVDAFVESAKNHHRYRIEDFYFAALSTDGKFAVLHCKDDFALYRFNEDGSPELIWRTPAITAASRSRTAFWSADNEKVMLVGAITPASDRAAIAQFDIKNGKWSRLAELPTSASPKTQETMASDNRRIVMVQNATVDLVLRDSTQGWGLATKEAGSVAQFPFTVELIQGINQPPVPVAKLGGREVRLSGVDPALQNVWVNKAQPFKWLDFDGQFQEGGLFLPRNFIKGQAVPLVIQTYHYIPGQFLPDGNTPVDAIQVLTARGIAVAQVATDDLIPRPSGNERISPNVEGAKFVRRIEAVIDELSFKGIADPDKIGVTGFSRSGYQVHYLVTHPQRTRIAAAIAADAGQLNLYDYLSHVPIYAPNVAENLYLAKGKSFWEDPRYWLDTDTMLNVDRANTPILLTDHGAEQPSKIPPSPPDDGRSVVIGAYKQNNKPMELLTYRFGQHVLSRSIERFAMLSSVGDWMDFWLNDKIDPDPAKYNQYSRWSKMKSDWQQQAAINGVDHADRYIRSRSGLRYRLETRVVGRSPEPGQNVRFAVTRMSPGGAPTGAVEQVDVQLPPSFATSTDMLLERARPGASPRREHWALEEAASFMHFGEIADLIVPGSMINSPTGTAASTSDDYVFVRVQLMGAGSK